MKNNKNNGVIREERRYKQIDKGTGPLRNLARGLLLDL